MEKKLGLALGGGAARGFAHVGVIRVLEGAGIPIHCVAGTSIGAIIGGMYAADKLDATEELINTLDWKKVTRFLDPLLPVSGLLGGKRLEALFASFLQDANIEDFAVPFAAVAGSPVDAVHPAWIAGLLIWFTGVAGESIADARR